MKNKYVGWIIIGISILIGIIVTIFNLALKKIVRQTCTHGSSCSMYDTIGAQTWMSLSIILIIVIIGFVIMFSKPKEKIITQEKIIIKKIKEKKRKLDLSKLDADEKKLINLLLKEGKAMFQADLMEKLEIGKVKTTRLLDKLEAKQFVERKRRGMNNIVVLKN